MIIKDGMFIYLVVSSGVIGQFLLEKLTECPVLSLQVKH